MRLPGSAQMGLLYELFASVEWWRLRPAQELLTAQPGTADAEKFIAAAKTENGDTVVVYTAAGGTVSLDLSGVGVSGTARWYDPRVGTWSDAGPANGGSVLFQTPTDEDYALVIKGK